MPPHVLSGGEVGSTPSMGAAVAGGMAMRSENRAIDPSLVLLVITVPSL